MAKKKPNVLLIAIDSLLSTHMSCYGYERQTTPHIDRFAEGATLFENTISPHIPTTSAYASMLTGMDCFTNQVVALRHRGPMRKQVKSAAEIFRKNNYNTSCIGFPNNPAGRGFANYVNYESWSPGEDGKCHKAEDLNTVFFPELDRLNKSKKPFFAMLRHMDPHSPYLPPEPYDRLF
ncbi:MAG: sulfatase-like hydrolase/transferase, partial [Lentisphaeria bacterium]|nr:sulfatase-like hydrolase/transferase [Lentisphaeria bacterium]